MKLSRDSWLYKFHKRMDTKVYGGLRTGGAVSLCQLFWSTVGTGIVCAFFAFVLLFLALILILGLVGLVSLLSGVYLDGFPYVTVGVTLGLSLFVSLIMLASLWKELEMYPTWWPEKLRIKKSTKEDKPQGLIVSYLKAKKAKVCPLVKLED